MYITKSIMHAHVSSAKGQNVESGDEVKNYCRENLHASTFDDVKHVKSKRKMLLD